MMVHRSLVSGDNLSPGWLIGPIFVERIGGWDVGKRKKPVVDGLMNSKVDPAGEGTDILHDSIEGSDSVSLHHDASVGYRGFRTEVLE